MDKGKWCIRSTNDYFDVLKYEISTKKDKNEELEIFDSKFILKLEDGGIFKFFYGKENNSTVIFEGNIKTRDIIIIKYLKWMKPKLWVIIPESE